MKSPANLSGDLSASAFPVMGRDFLLTLAIAPDMRRAAPHFHDPGRPHVLQAGQGRKDSLIMTHTAPETIAVPVDLLHALLEDASVLSAKVGLLLEANDVEIAPATVLPDNVVRLSDYRRVPRQVVSR
ncbi:hypothetical protein [Nonomuraea basaltis]|uniref:hypothetical protein n=1 Tax=Nonomuraea basaltis TaxID=2495887 RepID=UPI00110C6D7A|nr:hypothetical protein [Nonomuraea basaltis]TMS00217.1 hypothetical protein EJK15_03840 [Nonomuraea basaltis]